MSNPFKMKNKQETDRSLKGQSGTRAVLASLQKEASFGVGWRERVSHHVPMGQAAHERSFPPARCQGVPGARAATDFFGLQTP